MDKAMNSHSFILTTTELELLMTLETATNLENISQLLGKDISNISRNLCKIAEKLPVVEKQNNRWHITDLGKRLNQHTKDSIQFQRSLSKQESYLKIGTNREFSSRIFGPRIDELKMMFPNTQLRICAFEEGTEQPLLNGLIDIGIDCERPHAPDISYKFSISEKIVAVCSPSFKKTHSKSINKEQITTLPHLLCDRLYPDRLFKKNDNILNVSASFNDIATTRAACLNNAGWALLPLYAVQKELDDKTLILLDIPDITGSNYGVWWLRSRKFLEPAALKLKNWLSSVDLH
jgi:DNA-binding transcriptional LysR family regulator